MIRLLAQCFGEPPAGTQLRNSLPLRMLCACALSPLSLRTDVWLAAVRITTGPMCPRECLHSKPNEHNSGLQGWRCRLGCARVSGCGVGAARGPTIPARNLTRKCGPRGGYPTMGYTPCCPHLSVHFSTRECRPMECPLSGGGFTIQPGAPRSARTDAQLGMGLVSCWNQVLRTPSCFSTHGPGPL